MVDEYSLARCPLASANWDDFTSSLACIASDISCPRHKPKDYRGRHRRNLDSGQLAPVIPLFPVS